MQTNGSMSPVKLISATVAGQEIPLKFSFYAELKMDEYGIDLSKAFQILHSKPGNLTAYFKCFAALAASAFIERGQEPPTPEQWKIAVNASPTPIDDWKTILMGVQGAMFVKNPQPLAAEATGQPAEEKTPVQ